MNRSQLLLEKMKVLTLKTPSGMTQKVLLTDKPLGAKIPMDLLFNGIEFEIQAAINKASKRIGVDVGYNLSNILTPKQIQALMDNKNFKSFSRIFQDEIFNVAT